MDIAEIPGSIVVDIYGGSFCTRNTKVFYYYDNICWHRLSGAGTRTSWLIHCLFYTDGKQIIYDLNQEKTKTTRTEALLISKMASTTGHLLTQCGCDGRIMIFC